MEKPNVVETWAKHGGNATTPPHNLVFTMRLDDENAMIRDEAGNLIGMVRVAHIRKDRCRIVFSFPDRFQINRQHIDAQRFPQS